MATLTTQTAKINVVISLKGVNDTSKVMKRLEEYAQSYMNLYAFILHDRDVLDNGEVKTKHIHLVGLLKNNRQRLSTTLTNIADFVELDTLAVSIDKMSDIVGSLQYLLHKNNPDKHQYDIKDIVTNITSGELNTYLASDSKSMSIEYLIGVVENNKSKIEIMRIIGLSYYHLYRNTINDIYREVWENYDKRLG